MRIAINCRSMLRANRTGIGRYTSSLLNALGAIDHNNAYVLYAQKGIFDQKRQLPQFPYTNFKVAWDFLNLGPRRVLKKSDIYHVPSPQILEPKGPKTIVTIHDLIYLTHPQGHTPETIEATTRQMESIVQYAHHVICVSHATREDLHKFLRISRERTSVVYSGVNHELFYPLAEDEVDNALDNLEDLNIEGPYVLFVGTIEPRKNLKGVLQSFALLKKRKQFEGQLVVAGMKGWMVDEIHPLIKDLRLQDDVIFCGFVSDQTLRQLYALAEVFVFPSFYEGFGFPILEAFCCGSVVVTSNTSSCAEIAGDAALTVDPKSVEELAEALAHVLENKSLRDGLRVKGMKRAQEFTFEQTAKNTLAIYAQ